VSPALVFTEAADPAGATVIPAVTAQYKMHLIDKKEGQMSELLITRLAIKPEEVTDCKGVGPEVALRR
jgi:hypothetical protein